MQCAENQDGIWVYNGIITTHQQNHLHNLRTYVPEYKQTKAGLAQTKHPTPPTNAIQQPSMNHPQILTSWHVVASPSSCVHDPTSFIHLLHILRMSQIFSSLFMNYQLCMKTADSRCFIEGEINWQVNVADWNIMWICGV